MLICFFTHTPPQSQCYKQPSTAGMKKSQREKRRVEKGKPELFVDHISMPHPKASNHKFMSIKLTKAVSKPRNVSNSAWTVTPPPTGANNYDPLNPDRVVQKQFLLVRSKTLFTLTNWVLVKTEGVREWTVMNGL